MAGKKPYGEMSDDELMAQAEQNSAEWHNVGKEEQDALHAENVEINRILDSRRGETTTFDSTTGTWSPRKDELSGSDVGKGTDIKEPDYGTGGGSAGKFSYDAPPSYENNYQQQQIQDMYEQVMGREDFQYDPESDPLYAQYKDQYTRNGERAMEDTLGQVSARTGGLASTYAGSAAQGSYQQYMAELNDVLPQLEQLAWERYRAEGQDQRDNLDLLMAMEQRDYGRYLDQLGQYNADRSFAYGVDRDQREFDYRLQRDQVADKRYEDETAYARAQDQYNKDLQAGQYMAGVGEYGKLGELWKLSDEDIQRQTEKYLEDQRRLNDEEARGIADWYAQYGDPSKLEEMGVDTTALKRQWGIGEEPQSYQYISPTAPKPREEDYGIADIDPASIAGLGVLGMDYGTIRDLVEQGKLEPYSAENGLIGVKWAEGYDENQWWKDSNAQRGGGGR